ncbi:MAG: hypothetical protein Q9175_006738 [Cornicularia normoerica]
MDPGNTYERPCSVGIILGQPASSMLSHKAILETTQEKMGNSVVPSDSPLTGKGCKEVVKTLITTFAGDFDVPQDVGDARDWITDPTRKRQKAAEVLVAFEGSLYNEADDWQYLVLPSA